MSEDETALKAAWALTCRMAGLEEVPDEVPDYYRRGFERFTRLFGNDPE